MEEDAAFKLKMGFFFSQEGCRNRDRDGRTGTGGKRVDELDGNEDVTAVM